MKKSFGERLRALRDSASQADIGRKIGVSGQSWGFYERDQKEPNLETIGNICREFGVSADWLLGLSSHTVTANNSAVAIHNSTAHNGGGASETKALEVVASQQETISRLTAIIENLTRKESCP